MAEASIRLSGSKKEQYEQLLPIVQSLIEGEKDFIANLANVCAALKQGFNFFWVGFYLLKSEELVLGPFRGQLLVHELKKEKGCVEQLGKKKKQSLLIMLMNFQDTSLVVRNQKVKSLFQLLKINK